MNEKLTPHEGAVVNAQLVPTQAKTALQEFWKSNQRHIMSVTAGNDAERIMRVTYSVLYRTPKLIECTPFSLLNCIVLSHQMGLVLGTQEVSIVPFGKEATIIIGYVGKCKLALASKLITSIEAENVHECDMFVYQRSASGLTFLHEPKWKERTKATDENILGAYCQMHTSTGGVQTKFVPLHEILEARAKSRGYNYQKQKGGSDTPWMTDFGAMALKTAVHRAMKLAPQDASMGLANAVDDEDQGGQAVIAEGLDVSQFSEKDLTAPLVATGREAAAQIGEQKVREMQEGEKRHRRSKSEMEAARATSQQATTELSAQAHYGQNSQSAYQTYQGAEEPIDNSKLLFNSLPKDKKQNAFTQCRNELMRLRGQDGDDDYGEIRSRYAYADSYECYAALTAHIESLAEKAGGAA